MYELLFLTRLWFVAIFTGDSEVCVDYTMMCFYYFSMYLYLCLNPKILVYSLKLKNTTVFRHFQLFFMCKGKLTYILNFIESVATFQGYIRGYFLSYICHTRKIRIQTLSFSYVPINQRCNKDSENTFGFVAKRLLGIHFPTISTFFSNSNTKNKSGKVVFQYILR